MRPVAVAALGGVRCVWRCAAAAVRMKFGEESLEKNVVGLWVGRKELRVLGRVGLGKKWRAGAR